MAGGAKDEESHGAQPAERGFVTPRRMSKMPGVAKMPGTAEIPGGGCLHVVTLYITIFFVPLIVATIQHMKHCIFILYTRFSRHGTTLSKLDRNAKCTKIDML
jgi:hypothetical protein